MANISSKITAPIVAPLASKLGQDPFFQGGSGGGGAITISDVFSIDLYTGSSVARDIINGLDMTQGGLVWTKYRSAAQNHYLFDTERGINTFIESNTLDAETVNVGTVTAFNDDGYSLGTHPKTNSNGISFVSWCFRNSPKFLDIIEYTGDGVAGRQIPHSLGIQAGMVIVKNIDNGIFNWSVQHISRGGTKSLRLNETNTELISNTFWDDTTATNSVVTVSPTNNFDGDRHIMYVFAHDDSAEGVIQCGQYTGDNSASNIIDLGWEPQYIMIKGATSNSTPWHMFDATRGTNLQLNAASTAADQTLSGWVVFNNNGFEIGTANSQINSNGNDFIYIAIRDVPLNEKYTAVATGNTLDPIPNNIATQSLAVDNINNWVYQSCQTTTGSGRVLARFDLNGNLLNTIDPTGSIILGIAVMSDGSFWVIGNDEVARKYDINMSATGQNVNIFAQLGGQSGGMATDGTNIYVARSNNRTLYKYDMNMTYQSESLILSSIPERTLQDMDFDGTHWAVINQDQNVYYFDANWKKVSRQKFGANSRGLATTSAGKVWAASVPASEYD